MLSRHKNCVLPGREARTDLATKVRLVDKLSGAKAAVGPE